MKPEEIARYIQKQLIRKGADDAIVSLEEQESSQIKFSNSKISALKIWYDVNIGIFVAYKKRIMDVFTKEFSKASADRVVKRIMCFAEHIEPNKEYNGIARGPFKYKEIEKGFDTRIMSINQGRNIEYVEQAIEGAEEKGVKRVAGVLQTDISSVFLITSGNVEANDRATSIYFSLRALADKNASYHISYGARTLDGFNAGEIGRKAGSIANDAVNPLDGKDGRLDILFSPLAFANILSCVGEASSVFSVESGLSCLGNKLHKKVASPIVNLYDDGRISNALGSSNFDAEGVPTKRTTIIKDGILKTYLHNTSTAKRYNTETTANAGLIAPEPSNIILEKGSYSYEEMLKEVKEGYYITNLWYTRFNNYSKGDFSTIPRDAIFYIKNGKIKHPVKNIRISDNILNILSNIKSIGNSPEQIFGWDVEIPVITPMVLVKALNVTKPN